MSNSVISLGELLNDAELFTDGDWVESKDQDEAGNFRLIQLADIGDGYFVNKSARFMNQDAFIRLRCTELREGDLLIARMPDPLGRACIFPGDQKKCATVVDVCIIRPNQKRVDVDWLKHAINSQSVRMQIKSYSRGATRVRISRKDLANLVVPNISIAEQQRIAAILNKATEIKSKREQAIAKLDELAQSTFVEMFGDDACVTKTLNDLGTIKTGATPPSSKENMFGTQIPFVTPGDLGSGLQAKRLLTTEGARESVTVRAGAALVCCIGATIGKMDIAKEVSAFNQQINAIEWSDEINDVYGLYALKSIKGQVISNATSTTLPILKKSLFQQLKIKVPLHAKQMEFAEKVKQASQCIAEQKQSLKKIDALCLSLQHQAFTTGFNA